MEGGFGGRCMFTLGKGSEEGRVMRYAMFLHRHAPVK